MAANIYTPERRMGWWGGPDSRPRCDVDDKVAFPTEEQARASAGKAGNRGTPMKAYLGTCGVWHVSRVKRRT